jgi:regulator of sigma E protease
LEQPNIPNPAHHVKPANDTLTSPPEREREAGPVPTPPLTPTGWLMTNAPYLLIMAAGAIWLYRATGVTGLIQASLAILGLGFVIFIHELGHFLTAKWCDVHVQTFSIGFGPALPGCSFTRGETTYKLAVLPLGGYVNMVGEGPEADEDEDYPRSFKNKTVGQRMLIISAGVIMNVLFGALCFIFVYRYHGIDRPPAVVSTIEPGSRAWEQGVRPTWKITRIDNKKDPWFDDMRIAVALSGALSGKDQVLKFEFTDRDGNKIVKEIAPLRDDNNQMPMIGVTSPERLKLLGERGRRSRSMPVRYDSAAARARVLELGKGDVVLATSTEKDGKGETLLPGARGWSELCKRMSAAGSNPLWLRVQRAGAATEEQVELPAGGFDFGDEIVGTTDPKTPDEPFNVTPLPQDPGHEDKAADPFAFRSRMIQFAGKPVVIQVRRGPEEKTGTMVSLLVPPAFHKTLGLRMKMGKVANIREDSPAAETGLAWGDVIKGVKLVYGTEEQVLGGTALDPVRLPWELNKRIHADPKRDIKKWRVVLTVERTADHTQNSITLEPMRWDDSWKPGAESPARGSSPLSIPQLGIAYQVDSTVVEVAPGSPAAKAGLQTGDVIREVSIREGGKTPEEVDWSQWIEMVSKRGSEKVYDQWAHFFWVLQRNDFAEVKVKIARGGQDLSQEFGPMVADTDTTWPLADRGLILQSDARRQKAESFWEAVTFGLDWTTRFIKQIYLNLSSLLSGRISPKSLGGPVEIASQAFWFAGEGPFVFALFLGMISINLAVVNFLPIPVLDGGHMVFLIYEKIRGRPPSETVRAIATYAGLLLILALMVFVFYQDFKRRGWLSWLPSWW